MMSYKGEEKSDQMSSVIFFLAFLSVMFWQHGCNTRLISY